MLSLASMLTPEWISIIFSAISVIFVVGNHYGAFKVFKKTTTERLESIEARVTKTEDKGTYLDLQFQLILEKLTNYGKTLDLMRVSTESSQKALIEKIQHFEEEFNSLFKEYDLKKKE